MHKLTLLLCLASWLATHSLAQADILISGYTAATNDRFTNSSTFIATGFDLSGVGQTNSGVWGTLISSNVIVSASHLAPTGNISFYADNDPSSAPVTRNITDSMRIGTSDLWLARLGSEVDSDITRFQYATQQITSNDGQPIEDIILGTAGPYQDMNAYLMGRSPAVHPGTQDQAVGRNLISGIANNVEFNGGHTDALIMWLDASNSDDFVAYESRFVGGDSGAPLFVDSNGQLLLVGINSFVLENEAGQVLASGSTYLGNYSQQIQQFISASAVPEPSTLVLACLCAAAALHCRRRKETIAKSDYSMN